MDRTIAFEAGNGGSNPSGETICYNQINRNFMEYENKNKQGWLVDIMFALISAIAGQLASGIIFALALFFPKTVLQNISNARKALFVIISGVGYAVAFYTAIFFDGGQGILFAWNSNNDIYAFDILHRMYAFSVAGLAGTLILIIALISTGIYKTSFLSTLRIILLGVALSSIFPFTILPYFLYSLGVFIWQVIMLRQIRSELFSLNNNIVNTLNT